SDSAANPGATEYLLSKSNATTAGYAIYANTSGFICFGIDDDASWTPNDSACSTTDYYDGNWHYIYAVKLPTYILLFVDGTLAGQNTSLLTFGTFAHNLTLCVV